MLALCVALAVVVDVADPVAKAMGNLKALEAKFHAESQQLHNEAAAMKRQVGNERAESFVETGDLTQGAVKATEARLKSLEAKLKADGAKFHADAARPESTYVSAAEKAESKAKFEKLFSHKAPAPQKAPSSLLETEEQETAAAESVAEKRSKSFEERRAERKKQFEANEKKAIEQLSTGKVPADPSADLKSAVDDAFASADDASSFAETGASSRHQEKIQQLAQQLAADNDARFGAAPSSFLEAPYYPDYSKRDADEKARFEDLHGTFEANLKKDRQNLQARFDGLAPSSLLETMNPARAAELQRRLQQLVAKMKQDAAAEDKLDASFLEVDDPAEDQKEDAELKALEAKIQHDMTAWRQQKASFLEVAPGDISPDDREANALEDHELGQMERKLRDLDKMGKKMRSEYAKEKADFDNEKASSFLEAPDYSKRDADEKARFEDLHSTFEADLKKDRQNLQARFDGEAPSSLAETGRFSINDASGPDFDEFRKAQAEAADADSQFVQAVKRFNVMDGQPGAVITAAEMAASSFAQTSDTKRNKNDGDATLTPEEKQTNANLQKLEDEETEYHHHQDEYHQQELQEKIDLCKRETAMGFDPPHTCDVNCNCHNPVTATQDATDDENVENDDTGDTHEIAPGDGVSTGLIEAGAASLLEVGQRSDLFASMRALGAASESSLLQASETATMAERARAGAGLHAAGKAAVHRGPGGLPFKSTAEAEAENARGWQTVQAEIDSLKKASGDYSAEMSALPPVHLRILPESFAETKAQRREIPVLDDTSPTTDAVLAQEDEELADLTRESHENSKNFQAKLKATFTHEALKSQNYQALSDDPSERVYAGTDLGASSYLEEGQHFRR